MGLADLFSKEGRSRRNLEKNIQRATEKHAQSVDRWKALETLRDEGSQDAIAGLLRRFNFNYDKTIEDEQEKEWVYQSLCAMGKKVVPELRNYMRESDTLGWALKILESVSSGDSFAESLRLLCDWNDNSYVRDPSKKIQLVHFLGEHRDVAVAKLVVPYLEDVDEGVRFKAVEAAFLQGFREVVLGPLLKALANPAEESRRIKVAIIDGLAAAGWSLAAGEEATTVEKALSDLYIDGKLDKEKRVKLSSASR